MSTKREAPLRLFVALWPGRATRHAMAALRDEFHWPPAARPTATEKLHLTVHFLGAVPPARCPFLLEALALPAIPFELALDTVNAWPGGLVVLQPGEVPEALARLHAAIGMALRGLGLPVEKRRFKPHVTLARHGPAAMPLHAPAEPLRWRVDGHALVQSTPEGRYRVLRHYRHEAG